MRRYFQSRTNSENGPDCRSDRDFPGLRSEPRCTHTNQEGVEPPPSFPPSSSSSPPHRCSRSAPRHRFRARTSTHPSPHSLADAGASRACRRARSSMGIHSTTRRPRTGNSAASPVRLICILSPVCFAPFSKTPYASYEPPRHNVRSDTAHCLGAHPNASPLPSLPPPTLNKTIQSTRRCVSKSSERWTPRRVGGSDGAPRGTAPRGRSPR